MSELERLKSNRAKAEQLIQDYLKEQDEILYAVKEIVEANVKCDNLFGYNEDICNFVNYYDIPAYISLEDDEDKVKAVKALLEEECIYWCKSSQSFYSIVEDCGEYSCTGADNNSAHLIFDEWVKCSLDEAKKLHKKACEKSGIYSGFYIQDRMGGMNLIQA